MEFQLNFFEYKKNCKEFTILKRATSKTASRADLKKGQLLFSDIYKNIVIINSKLYTIKSSIIERKLKITGSREMEIISPHEYELKFPIYTNFNLNMALSINTQHEMSYYYGLIQLQIDHVLEYLDSNFDHEELKENIINLEKLISLNKNDISNTLRLHSYKRSIEDSIIGTLKYYSNISSRLIKYFKLFVEIENDEIAERYFWVH